MLAAFMLADLSSVQLAVEAGAHGLKDISCQKKNVLFVSFWDSSLFNAVIEFAKVC